MTPEQAAAARAVRIAKRRVARSGPGKEAPAPPGPPVAQVADVREAAASPHPQCGEAGHSAPASKVVQPETLDLDPGCIYGHAATAKEASRAHDGDTGAAAPREGAAAIAVQVLTEVRLVHSMGQCSCCIRASSGFHSFLRQPSSLLCPPPHPPCCLYVVLI